MSTPWAVFAPLNGSLGYQDEAGGGTLTGAGALTYLPFYDPNPESPWVSSFQQNGTINGTNREGAVVVTGTGAVRYRASSGARTNYVKNPRFANDTTGWSAQAGATVTRVVDAEFQGGTACEVACAASTTSGLVFTGGSSIGGLTGFGQTVTLSFDAKLVSGAADLWVVWKENNAAGTELGSGGSSIVTLSNNVQRVTLTYTTSFAGVHQVRVQFRRASAVVGTFRISNIVIEPGNIANPTYFDGTSAGAGWLDPITGILGTAHASASASRVETWYEVATTNLVANPSLETGATGWGYVGTGVITNSRVTTHAYIGSYALQTVCDGSASGQGPCWESVASMASATNGTTYTASVWVRAVAGSPTVALKVVEYNNVGAWLAETSSGPVVLTDQWQRITVTRTFNQATVAYVGLRIQTTTPQAVTFVSDAFQIEAKAYASSYCDGSLGTGYSWTGTAHATTSVRAAASGSVTLANNAWTDRGSAAFWFTGDNFDTFNSVFRLGTYNGSPGDHIGVDRTAATTLRMAATTNGNAASIPATIANATRYFVYVEWTPGQIAISLNGGAKATASRLNTPAGYVTNGDRSLWFGNTSAGGANALNGTLYGLQLFDQPLTDADIALLYNGGTPPQTLLTPPTSYPAPAVINWCYNPSYEVDATGWTPAASTIVSSTDDAKVGSRSGKWTITNSVSTAYIISPGNVDVPCGLGDVLRVGVWVKGVGTAIGRTIQVQTRFYDGSGAQIATTNYGDLTLDGTWQYISGQQTAGNGYQRWEVMLRSGLTGTRVQAGDVVYVDGWMITKNQYLPSSYFDGSYGGGSWIDPNTGVPGTAHNSPSASGVGVQILEATTNYVTDPLMANTPSGAALRGSGANLLGTDYGRDTNVYLGPGTGSWWRGGDGTNSAKGLNFTTATGLGLTGQRTFSGSVWVRASAGNTAIQVGMQAKHTDASFATATSVNITISDTWTKVEIPNHQSTAGKDVDQVYLYINFNGIGANGVKIYAANAQIEQKAYCTPFCAGSLGTGYTWNGSANASSSNRAVASVRIPEPFPQHLKSDKGAVYARFMRTFDNGGTCEIVNVGDYNNAGKDCLQLYISSGDQLTSSWRNGNVGQVTPGIAGVLEIGRIYAALVTWDGANMDLWRDTVQATPITNRLYTGDINSVLDYEGLGCTPAASAPLCGVLRDVCFFSRPLTVQERAKLGVTPALSYNVIRDALHSGMGINVSLALP